MVQCWDFELEKRPDISQVCDEIEEKLRLLNGFDVDYSLDDLKQKKDPEPAKISLKTELNGFLPPFIAGPQPSPAYLPIPAQSSSNSAMSIQDEVNGGSYTVQIRESSKNNETGPEVTSKDEPEHRTSETASDLSETLQVMKLTVNEGKSRSSDLKINVNSEISSSYKKQLPEGKSSFFPRLTCKTSYEQTNAGDDKQMPTQMIIQAEVYDNEEANGEVADDLQPFLINESLQQPEVATSETSTLLQNNSNADVDNNESIAESNHGSSVEDPKKAASCSVGIDKEEFDWFLAKTVLCIFVVCIEVCVCIVIDGFLIRTIADQRIPSDEGNTSGHSLNGSNYTSPSVVVVYDSSDLLSMMGFLFSVSSIVLVLGLRLSQWCFSKISKTGILKFLPSYKPLTSILLMTVHITSLILCSIGVLLRNTSQTQSTFSNGNSLNDSTPLEQVGLILVILPLTIFVIHIIISYWILKDNLDRRAIIRKFISTFICSKNIIPGALIILTTSGIFFGLPFLYYQLMGSMASCVGNYNLTNGSTGMVASPSYLSTTQHNFNCTFFFHARPGYRVELDMEVDIESCCDYIDIYDEEDFIRKLTGMIPHTDVLSIGQVLKLVYNSNRASSNHKVASKGFLARYRQFSCGGHYEINNGTTGVVTSPNYPNNTMYNFQCTYTFHAQPGHGVKLSLLVDTEACCAKIEIFDGKVLKKILEGKDQKIVMSEEQSLKLVYTSDYTDTDSKIASKGFWAKYEQNQLTQ
ncbi:uncharacterized protein LOC143451422 isoform X2 [Clavelina lepadiformis]|uniref:uncharacterized protein LOC143451422 isoform X2 n=1 Tax=Clavelina lepadiformis TaxID=159417 RepID=UPI0040429462